MVETTAFRDQLSLGDAKLLRTNLSLYSVQTFQILIKGLEIVDDPNTHQPTYIIQL
jgi:hypothetical protein